MAKRKKSAQKSIKGMMDKIWPKTKKELEKIWPKTKKEIEKNWPKTKKDLEKLMKSTKKVLDKSEKYLRDVPPLVTIREGETSLSDLWQEYHLCRISEENDIPIDDVLRKRVRREFPLPEHLDFRMKLEQYS